MGVALPRKKKRNLFASAVYRMIWLPLSESAKLKLFLNLEWMFERLAHETSYAFYKPDEHPMRRAGVDFILDLIEPEFTVLDLGCSEGQITRMVAEKAKFAIGVDHSEKAIAAAQQASTERVEFYCGDAREFLAANERQFDVLILSHILEHLDEPESFLNELTNHFRFVYVEVPDFDRSIFNHIRKDLSMPLIYTDADHVNEFGRSELQRMLEKCELRILRSEFIFGVQRYWCATERAR